MSLILKNKKAYFDYEILETYEAGIVLSGAEVKSIRNAKANLKGSYVAVKNSEAFIENMHISSYQPKNQPDYDPTRRRKLLLKKAEIDRLADSAEQRGLTIIPLEIFSKSGLIKMKIGLCRGRKKYDKREVLKKRQQEKDIRRMVSG